MLKGLFVDSGTPSYETFYTKLNSLRKLIGKEKKDEKKKDKISRDGNIAYLPNRGTAVFIGDLHGDFEALVSIVNQLDFLNAMKDNKNVFLVFLGDYGDRGEKIIETINEVITLKLLHPENVILLKGNHEEMRIAEAFGTYDAFLRAYGRERGEFLFEFYCETMSDLPAIAITANGIIGVHGGIPNQDIESLEILNTEKGESLIREITWNDPSSRISERGFNNRGGSTTTFGEKAFERFMKIVPAALMVRSHQYPPEGVELFFENRLATIFSNGSERSLSSDYSLYVHRPVFLKIGLTSKKDKFKDSDFIEVLY